VEGPGRVAPCGDPTAIGSREMSDALVTVLELS
jgi:hypothetical protein